VDLSLDPAQSGRYHSHSQISKTLSETWVGREAYCLNCGSGSLGHTPENTKALDFRCSDCREPYELKASRRPFGNRVLDGAYRTFVEAISSHDNPNLLLLNYDLQNLTVSGFRAISRHALSRLSIIPRRPLGPTARRAGWQGCSIDLTGLPPAALVSIVESGVPRDRKLVLSEWNSLSFIARGSATSRDWLPDIMSCIKRIDSEDFSLAEVYSFDRELGLMHPKNLNVRPKIRQQLQILVAQGLLERTRPGLYRKTTRF
jgi:type II restriction enzyme